MRQEKVIVAILLSVLMTLSLCACGAVQSTAEPTPTAELATEEAVTTESAEKIEEETAFYMDYENKYDSSKPIYVIGHLSPDTDTVCSAIAYANLLNQLGYEAIPAITGEPNAETSYVLEMYGVGTPELLTEAGDKQFVLVDHSEYTQSLPGMENATVLGILDHHGVGDIGTADPILYVGMPVGCTSTIIYKMYKDNGVNISKDMAGIMMSAILSDTKGLRSSTTTDYDTEAVEALSSIAGVEDTMAYTVEMMNAANVLDSMTTEEILKYDYKEYTAGSTTFSVAVVQSADADQLSKIAQDIDQYMEENFDSLGVQQCYVMLTNQITMETELLCYGDGALKIAQKAFNTEESNIILPDTSSRKKQVVPPLTEVLEAN